MGTSWVEYLKSLSVKTLFPVSYYGISEDNTSAGNAAALTSAIVNNKIIKLPNGRFNIDNILFPNGNVIIEGAGSPNRSVDGTILEGGTVLTGGLLNLNNQRNITFRNLGIERAVGDTIDSGTPQNGEQFFTMDNVTLLGGGLGHGVVMTSGDYNRITNCRIYNFKHPFALRGNYNTVSNVYVKDCSVSSGIIKAIVADGIPTANHNIVTNINIEGSTLGDASAIWLNAFDSGSSCRYNIMSNITSKFSNYGIRVNGLGNTQHNIMSNINIYRPLFKGLLIQDGANHNTFNNVRIHQSAGNAFELDGTGNKNYLYGCAAIQTGGDIIAEPNSGTFAGNSVTS